MYLRRLACLILTLATLVAVAVRAEPRPETFSSDSSATADDPEDTPVTMEAIERPVVQGAERPWAPPRFSGQEQALGWTPEVFNTPKGMEERVAFWTDIYTKYTTNQGILHDSRYMGLIYQVLDFGDIQANTELSATQKERARRARVKGAKKSIQNRLEMLQKMASPESLSAEDQKLWQLFAKIDESKKFLEASRKGRLRFQLGQRDRIIEGIYQSGRNLDEMQEIFRSEGLPIELTRIPFVESSFNMKARSRVGASGIWQFMRSTAKSYLHMDSSTDERNDPLHATRAAARKLRNNYEMLRAWPLAVTGWNHGPTGVQRLVRKYKTTDIAELTDVRRGRFGFASANFYASFLAALQVEMNAAKYFGALTRMPELRAPELKLDRPLASSLILDWFGGDLNRAQDFNPHIRSHIWKGGTLQKKNFVRVPPDKLEAAKAAIAAAPVQVASVEKSASAAKAKQAVDTDKPTKSKAAAAQRSSAGDGAETTHVVEPGETLGDIAREFKVKLSVLLDVNGITNPRALRAGTKLVIPTQD